MGKTIIVEDWVHEMIMEYQKKLREQIGYEVQIKEIVAKSVKKYIDEENQKEK